MAQADDHTGPGYGRCVNLEIPGLMVGHWTESEALTGVTVIVLPDGSTASGEVRGGAPATREFALLDPQCLVDRVDAVVLSGGSAFGLASADGVVSALEESGRGFPTAAGAVPIVIGMSLYDLNVGDASVRPGPAQGRAALMAADSGCSVGRVGAGTGATTGKWRGADHATPGGFGAGNVTRGDLRVTAMVAVNSVGDVGPIGREAADTVADGSFDDWPDRGDVFANTTIGVVVTNAALDKSQCLVVAQGCHDGLARVITPPHTRSDGDAFVAAATGGVDFHVDDVRLAAMVAVERAVMAGVDTLDG